MLVASFFPGEELEYQSISVNNPTASNQLYCVIIANCLTSPHDALCASVLYGIREDKRANLATAHFMISLKSKKQDPKLKFNDPQI